MNRLDRVIGAVSGFGFSASANSPEDEIINVKNRKGKIAAVVRGTEVEQRYEGKKNLCGALIRKAIKTALAA